MKISNTSRYSTSEVKELVEFACRSVNMRGVAVNVKNTRQVYAGRAYWGVPSISPHARNPTVDYLVTVRIGSPDKFPVDSYYGNKYKTTIPYSMQDWKEALVAVAAHEAYHIHQFKNRLPRSEIAAERFALARLEAYRSGLL